MVEQIDISDANGAREAAERTAEQIRTLSEEMGQDPNLEVTLRQDGDQWVVGWNSALGAWAVRLFDGQGVWEAEPEVVGLGRQEDFIGEIKNDQELVFTPN